MDFYSYFALFFTIFFLNPQNFHLMGDRSLWIRYQYAPPLRDFSIKISSVGQPRNKFFFDFKAKKLQNFNIFRFFPTLGPNETMLPLSTIQNKGTIGCRWGSSFKSNFFLVRGHSAFFARPKKHEKRKCQKINFCQVQRVRILIRPSFQAILVDTPPKLRTI